MKSAKTRKAIRVLQRQRDMIKSKNDLNRDWPWLANTRAYIKLYFGENSTQFKFIDRFDFTILIRTGVTAEVRGAAFEQEAQHCVKFLDGCIIYLQTHGVYKNKSADFTNEAKWKIFGIACGALAFAFYLGIIVEKLFPGFFSVPFINN